MIGIFTERINEAEISGDLRSVQVFPAHTRSPDTMHVRVGAAVTAEELRKWAVNDGWSLLVDVAADE